MRYCSACGQSLTERHVFGKARPHCAACNRTFFEDPKLAVAVVIAIDGRILLQQRDIDPGRGAWTFPSGYVDRGEIVEEAAAREVLEEVNLAVRIDRLLGDYRVAALVGPTMPPAWKIDAVNGDQISGGGAGSLAAVAGYPHLTVPMALVKGLPVGLSFIGPKWSEALLLSLGYAYEHARGPFPMPSLQPSIETSPLIAPALEPVRR